MRFISTPQAIHKIKQEFARLGYVWFDESNEFDLNIFGIRHPEFGNVFNDLLCVAYWHNGWHLEVLPGTTDPGRSYLQQPMNSGGTAIVKPGQYRGVWQLGLHRKSYEALVQTGGEITIWRDVDKDALFDFDPSKVSTGFFGINMHKAGTHSTQVDKWSAGCQVFANQGDFEKVMHLARMQRLFHPTWTKYSYTLFTLMDEPGCQASPALDFLFDIKACGFELAG